MRIEVEPGVGLHVQDLGSGRPVVFIAGFGLDHTVWDTEVRLLAEDHRTVCIDTRGHGLSDKPLTGYGIDRLAQDVLAVLEHLDLRDLTLVGWSLGGLIAFNVASQTDRLRQLALVGSNGVRASRSDTFPFGLPPEVTLPALIEGETTGRLAARRQTIGSGFAGDPDPDALEFLLSRSLLLPSWAAVQCYETLLTTDLIAAIPRVTIPVLQVKGMRDPVMSAKGAAWLQEQLTDARLVELEDCGHYPMFEAPAAFDEALLTFVGTP